MIASAFGASGSTAGWHGKLPTVGDFVTRRLDSDFVHVWDNWLSAGLAKLRTEGNGQWLADYLASPTWRFMLTPGFLPAPLQAQTWAGVVMPSVDRVGRYYPLTMACVLPYIPYEEGAKAGLWSWLHQLEDLAVDALQEDWSIDDLEEELARLGAPAMGMVNSLGVASSSVAEGIFSTVLSPNSSGATGRCIWFSDADSSLHRTVLSLGLDDSILSLWKN